MKGDLPFPEAPNTKHVSNLELNGYFAVYNIHNFSVSRKPSICVSVEVTEDHEKLGQ